jgi:thiol-disulfide isomerase/thioredoxin
MQKRFFSLLPLAIILTALLFHTTGDPLPLGSPIPNPGIKLKDISGKEVSLSEAKTDKGLLVMFSCNTCPIVKKYQSRTMEVCKHATDNNIGIILLNSNEATRGEGDSFDDMKEYAKQQGYYFNYVLDDNSKMADAFGAIRTPEIFLFDKDGKLVYHGAIDDNSTSPDEVTRKHAILAIDELATGKEISKKETRSVGCAIKRKS